MHFTSSLFQYCPLNLQLDLQVASTTRSTPRSTCRSTGDSTTRYQIYRHRDRGPRSVTLTFIQTPVVTELKQFQLHPFKIQDCLRNTDLRVRNTLHLSKSCVMFWEPDTSNFSCDWLLKKQRTFRATFTYELWLTFWKTEQWHFRHEQLSYDKNRSSNETDLQSDLQPILRTNLHSDLHTDLLADLQDNLQDLQEIYRQICKQYNIGESRQPTNSSFCESSSHLIYLFTRKCNGSSCWNW